VGYPEGHRHGKEDQRDRPPERARARAIAVTQLEIALDTAHEDSIAPFWSVLFTGSPDNKIYDSIFDPTGWVPGLWFQGTENHETPRQRWHFDLWVAPDAADERIAAAGGMTWSGCSGDAGMILRGAGVALLQLGTDESSSPGPTPDNRQALLQEITRAYQGRV
jgi:hypothetical protein